MANTQYSALSTQHFMYVGVALFDLHIESAQSLKEKRMVVRSLRDKVRNKFDVSAAEVGFNDLHQRAQLGVTFVSNSAKIVDSQLEAVARFVESAGDARIIGTTLDVLQYESDTAQQMGAQEWDLPFEEKDEEES